MNDRRRFLGLAAIAATAHATRAHAAVESADYPTQPIRLVATFPVGAPFDAVSRKLADVMGALLKVSVLVDNKPGAAGSLGASEVLRSAPDGYTLLITIADPLVTTPATLKVPYDPQRDFMPIGKIASSAPVLMINTGYKATNLRELVDEMKAARDPLTYGSFGPASFPQLVMEAFTRKAGLKAVEVPYRGAPPAVQDMLGGQIAMAFTSPSQAAQLATQGRARALASMGNKRSVALPNVPTFTEAGFDSYFARRESWLGLLGSAKLNPKVAVKISESMQAAVHDPQFAQWLRTLDFDAIGGTPQQMQKDLELEIRTISKFIREELKIEPSELREGVR